MLIDPMLEFINRCDPWENGKHSFQLVLLCPSQVFLVIKEHIPVIHTEQLHGHAGHFCNFHGVFLEGRERQMMRQERMNGVAAFMYHGGNITHLSRSIHENEWRAG